MSILNQLKAISRQPWYWLIYLLGGIFLIAAALYFQYFREELPCTLCIQVRLWVTLFVIVSIIGLLLRNNTLTNKLAQIIVVVIAGALIERSYLLLGTERGFVFTNCGVELGLPAWFAIDQWLPWLYRVETSCGYTPIIAFGITMAETLMVLSVLLLIVSLTVLIASLFKTPGR